MKDRFASNNDQMSCSQEQPQPNKSPTATVFTTASLRCEVLTHHNTFYAMTFLKKQAVIKIVRVRKRIHTPPSSTIQLPTIPLSTIPLPANRSQFSLNSEDLWMHRLNSPVDGKQDIVDEGEWDVDDDDESVTRKHVGMIITFEDYIISTRSCRPKSFRTNNYPKPKRDIYRPRDQTRPKHTSVDYSHFIQKFHESFQDTFTFVQHPRITEHYEIVWREIGTNDWYLWAITSLK